MIQDDDNKVTKRLEIPIDEEILASYGFSHFPFSSTTNYRHDTIPYTDIVKTIDGSHNVVYIATIEIFNHEGNYVKKTVHLHTVANLIEYKNICKQMNTLRDRVKMDGAIIEAKVMHLGVSWYTDSPISNYSAPKLI